MKEASRARSMATLAIAQAFVAALSHPFQLVKASLQARRAQSEFAAMRQAAWSSRRGRGAKKDGEWRGRWTGSMKVKRFR